MKILIKFLVFAMLLQMLPCSVSAESNIVLNESFENYVTGAFPSSYLSGGAMNAYVAEVGSYDKALCMVKRADYAGRLSVSFDNVGGEYVVSFKVKPEGGSFSGGVRLMGNATETLVTFENNAIFTGAGKRYGMIKDGEWTEIDIVVAENTQRRSRYDLYINKSKVIEQWKLDNSAFAGMSGLQFYSRTTASDVNFYIDDVRVYTGDKLIDEKSFPKKEYNARSVDFKEKDFGVGTSVLIKEDFEKGLSSSVLAFTGAGSKVDYYDEDRKSNCMSVDDASFGKYNLFINQKGLKALPKLVYQADICPKSFSGTTEFFQFRYDADSKVVRTATLNDRGGGVLSLYDNTQVASLKLNTWYTIAAAYDYMNQTFDFYVDGKLVKDDMPFYDKNYDEPSSSRILYWTLTNKTQVLVDNVFVYEGEAPRDILTETENVETLTEISSAWTPDSVAENLLNSTVAFHATSGAVWTNNQKAYPESGAAFIENDIFYLPLRTVSEAAGKQIGWDGATGAVTVDGVSLKDGERNVKIGGKDITLSGAVTIKDGVTYVPSDIFAKDRLFGMKVTITLGGTVVLDAPDYTDSELVEINRYMVGERPTPMKVKEDYLASGNKGVHPRLFADKDRFEELKALIKEDGYHKKWYEAYLKKAEGYFATSVVPYEAANRVNNGNEAAKRVQTMSLLYRLTGEKKYLDRAYQEMEAILLWPVWEDGLNAGTIGYLLAVGYDWCYDGLSDAQRKNLEESMRARCLSYLESSYSSPTWGKYDSNWNFVSNSAAIAALVLTDVYPEACYGVIANVVRSLEYGLETFTPDGQWYEGAAYWSYAVEHMVPIFMGLESVLGTEYHLTKFRGVDKTADYIISMQGPAGSYNYSDTINTALTNMPGIFYLSETYNRPEWTPERLRMIEENGFDIFLVDFLTYKPQEVSAAMPNNMYFRAPYGDIAVLRGDSKDSGSLYLAYRAGKARVSHGHQDAGSFIMDMNGIRWAEELGREAYSVPGYNTNGDSRWTFYKTRAEGHNTIVIDPDMDHARNLDGTGYVEKSDLKDAGGYTIMNLDEVYNIKAKGYRRGFKIDDKRMSVVIRDEIDLKAPGEVYWFMHTKADIEVQGNRAILTQGEEKLYMDFIIEGGAAEIYKAAAEPFPLSPNPEVQTKHTNYNKVMVKVNGTGRVNITVKMYDINDKDYISSVENTPLDLWTAPEYEFGERPKLTGIYFNGKLADGFSPNGGSVLYSYDYDGKKPEVTASCDEGVAYEMRETEGEDGKTVVEITAYSKADRASYRRYRAVIKCVPYLRYNLDGFKRYEAVAITSSHKYDKTLPPANLGDGKLDTNFAIQGIGYDVADIDLGESVEINAFAIGFMDAYNRENVFDISVSEDGVNYTKIYSGKSTMLTDGYEIRLIEPVKARYMRYTGYGNSVNNWNNLTEFAALLRN